MRLARFAIPIVVVVLLVMYAGVGYLIAAGVTGAEREDLEDSLAAHGIAFEDVDFESRTGDVSLNGWYVAGQPSSPTIIFVHGIGSQRTGDLMTEFAATLYGEGFGFLMFDLRAHGLSEGDKTTGGYHERFDVLGAFDYLQTRGIAPGKIGVLGLSMGAGTSAMTAAEESAITALVLDSPYAVASELIAQETARKTPFPEWLVPMFIPMAKMWADLLYDIDVNAMAPEKVVSQLGYPIMVIYGTGDTRIPVDHGQRVFDAAPQGSVLWAVEGSDHLDAYIEHPDDYAERVIGYFRDRLGVN
ncbi:MAG: alpha/beta fold hydrolase [SAR202 cluster bacterium]|jgi:pimeloyl-ACP methyl ester carboxylesterase|nr:alpha/beta fold hydrolase [SAR202 cluster bacterium]MDP6512214.1 alpha/beta fold hydrolase [SAR202 cluster bacterium]